MNLGGGALIETTGSTTNAGSIKINAGSLQITGMAGVNSVTGGVGKAGHVDIAARSVEITGGGFVNSSTSGEGLAGDVSVKADSIALKGGAIASLTAKGSKGNGGTIRVEAGSLQITEGGRLNSSTEGQGHAGNILAAVGTIALNAGGAIESVNREGSTGNAGTIGISARSLEIAEKSEVSSSAFGAGNAGSINIKIDSLLRISGGGILTNSVGRPGGDIAIIMAENALLILEGGNEPAVIETSSAPTRGGSITIKKPLAIISNGGRILARGQDPQAFVDIEAGFFINSADRLNVLEVQGTLVLQAQVDDVSSGTLDRDLSVIDASRVLRGQCPTARSTGILSQLTVRPIGPYSAPPTETKAPPAAAPDSTLGGCL